MEIVENIQYTSLVVFSAFLLVCKVEGEYEKYKGVKVNGWWQTLGGFLILACPAVFFVTTIIRVWS